MNTITRKRTLLWGVCLWVASMIYISQFVDRGWIPHDEGLLGQSAERILTGALPPRDSHDFYPGGLSYLPAPPFKLFGPRLISLPWPLLFFFILWVPAVFWIASRFSSPPGAAL